MKDGAVKTEKVVDAKGRALGRVATEAAQLLRGKTAASFAPNILPTTRVRITNAGSLHIPEKKRKNKEYRRYTGYPGGLRSQMLEDVIIKKGIGEVLRLAVYGMLPNNKQRPRMMSNLSIEE